MRRGFFGAAAAVPDAVVVHAIQDIAVRYVAASKIQALARGCASCHRDAYRLLAVAVTLGDRFVRSAANFVHYVSWLAAEFEAGGARRDAAQAVHGALVVTHHSRAEVPLAPMTAFGPLSAVWCHRRPCTRCDGAGAYDREGPFWTGARGGYHFRHVGLWTVEGVQVVPDIQYQTVGQYLVEIVDN